jgi:hypothetical protein
LLCRYSLQVLQQQVQVRRRQVLSVSLIFHFLLLLLVPQEPVQALREPALALVQQLLELVPARQL